jgi:hypothetical protein
MNYIVNVVLSYAFTIMNIYWRLSRWAPSPSFPNAVQDANRVKWSVVSPMRALAVHPSPG